MNKLLSERWAAYVIAVAMLAVVTLFGVLARPISFFDPFDIDLLYLLAVAISAAFLGLGPALLVAFAGQLALDFFFIPPFYTFTVASEQNTVTLLLSTLVAVGIALLAPKLRR